MSARVVGTVFVSTVFAVPWVAACIIEQPAPATPVAATTSAPATTTAPTTTTTPTASGSSQLLGCAGNANPGATPQCVSCMQTSCAAQINALGSACPGFTTCICGGGNLATCGPSNLTGSCAPLGEAVGACTRQSCAMCATTGTAPSATASASAPPAGDACTTLGACCPNAPTAVQGSCTQAAANKDVRGCNALLTALRATGTACP
jgi:hypothetical protein